MTPTSTPDTRSPITRAQLLIQAIIADLSDHPEAVQVSVVEGRVTTIYELAVHPDDAKRVIGRGGETIDALRALVARWGGRVGGRWRVDVLESLGG